MNRTLISHRPFFILTLAMVFSGLGACSNLPKEYIEALNTTTKIYNNALEGKGGTGGSDFVKKEMRPDYVLRYVEFRERVSVEESQVIDTTYLKDGEPVDITLEDPDRKLDFNQAVITMHYRYVKMPDNRLQDLIHKQHWFLKGKRWEIEPDLDPFLE